MAVTYPQLRAFMYLALTGLLLSLAVAMLAYSHGRRAQDRASKVTVVATSVSATPGSTAHARQLYRSALGR